jgi:hypothetical protein
MNLSNFLTFLTTVHDLVATPMTLGDGILMTVTIQAEDNLMILMTLVKVL